MEKWQMQIVILYGTSLLLTGLETCLQDSPGLRVVRLDGSLPDTAQRLQALKPDAIIFDRNDQSMRDLSAVVQLLQGNSNALVVGLDVNNDDLIVLSNHQHAAGHPDDLLAAIRSRLRHG